MQLILITQRNRKVNKCNVSYCEVLLFLQSNFMLNPVRLPKHTYTQRACDRWQILLKHCYVHKSFAPAWGEAANRSRRTIEPVSAWAAPRRETIRLQAAESRYDKLCVLSESLVCVCVCYHCPITSGISPLRLQRCWWHTGESCREDYQPKSNQISHIMFVLFKSLQRNSFCPHEPVQTQTSMKNRITWADDHLKRSALHMIKCK